MNVQHVAKDTDLFRGTLTGIRVQGVVRWRSAAQGAFGPAVHSVSHELDVGLRRLHRQQVTDAIYDAELPSGVQLHEPIH
jgi:hypothetical protein